MEVYVKEEPNVMYVVVDCTAAQYMYASKEFALGWLSNSDCFGLGMRVSLDPLGLVVSFMEHPTCSNDSTEPGCTS